jgi:hypothetical protein
MGHGGDGRVHPVRFHLRPVGSPDPHQRKADGGGAWAKLDALVEAQEDKTFPPPSFPIADKPDFHVFPLCDLVKKEVVSVKFAAAGATPFAAESGKTETHQRYLTARQAHLCDQRARVTQDLFVVTMHLQFWNSVIAGPCETIGISDGWRMPNPFRPAVLFGVAQNTLEQFADREGKLCSELTLSRQEQDGEAKGCKSTLWTLIDRSRNVAESILGSITQYVLPNCYGLLGAMAAALRLRRRKVDAATLVPTTAHAFSKVRFWACCAEPSSGCLPTRSAGLRTPVHWVCPRWLSSPDIMLTACSAFSTSCRTASLAQLPRRSS